MKRNALICLFIGIMLLMWVGCDTGSASSADSNTNNTGITNGNGDNNGNNGGNNNNDENGENNGNDNENNNGDNGNGNSSSELFPAPTNFRVVSTTSSSVSLTWDEVSGAYCYIIGYGSSTGNAASEFSYTNNITISNLDSNTEYFFRVTALNENYDRGTSSSYIYGTTSAEELLPAPTNLQSTSTTTNSITLSWNSVSGALAYLIKYSDDVWFEVYETSTSYSTQATISSLKSDTMYHFEIYTYNQAGQESSSCERLSVRTQSSSSGGSSGNGGSSGGNTSNNDNSILENVERDYYDDAAPIFTTLAKDKKSIQLTDNKQGLLIQVDVSNCFEGKCILYRSTTSMNDLSAYKKISTKTISNSEKIYFEDFDIVFEKGNTYYYIAVAADTATSKEGIFSEKAIKFVPQDCEIIWYGPSNTQCKRTISIDDEDDVFTLEFAKTDNTISDTLRPGYHSIDCAKGSQPYYTITSGYQFLAGCRYAIYTDTVKISDPPTISSKSCGLIYYE